MGNQNANSVAEFISTLEHDLRVLDMTRSDFLKKLSRLDSETVIGSIHEAGHCVAAWAFGFPILEMSIDEYRRDRDGLRNMSAAFEVSAELLNEHLAPTKFQMAVIAMAGIMAERRQSGVIDDAAFEGDCEKALNHLRQFFTEENDLESYLTEVLDDVDEILDDHWEKIEMLAIAAYKLGPVLDGHTVKEIIERA